MPVTVVPGVILVVPVVLVVGGKDIDTPSGFVTSGSRMYMSAGSKSNDTSDACDEGRGIIGGGCGRVWDLDWE